MLTFEQSRSRFVWWWWWCWTVRAIRQPNTFFISDKICLRFWGRNKHNTFGVAGQVQVPLQHLLTILCSFLQYIQHRWTWHIRLPGNRKVDQGSSRYQACSTLTGIQRTKWTGLRVNGYRLWRYLCQRIWNDFRFKAISSWTGYGFEML